MATMGHTEKEQIREDIELLQMTLQGTEDEFSLNGDETGLIMDVEEGSIPGSSIAQRSTVIGTETPITIFSEDDTESQCSQERSVSMASTSQDEVQYVGPPISEDSLAYDPETCLALNRAYQELVQNNLQKIEAVLAENRARQVAIHENMDIANRNAKEQKTEKKKIQLYVYQMPYFKDMNGACPPPNLDVQMKRAIEEPMPPNKRLKTFNKNERKKLIESVQADNLQRWLRPLMTRLELQQERLMRTTDPDEEAALKQQIQTTERGIERVNSLSPMEMAGTIEDADKVDWMKIAAADFDGRTTSHLQQSWKNSLHPAINWNNWTETEDKNLAEIVEVKNAVNWEEIAGALGTGRTAFQCIQRYQQRLNPNHCNHERWSPEENEQLLELVKITEKLEGSVTNWAQIALAFDGRMERQCLTQYNKINPDQTIGRWTEEEDSKLLAGIRTLGPKRWYEIAKLVPGRNGVQCRERWCNSLSINLKLGEWTYQEDRAIILNHQKHNGQWSKIAQCLPGRTDNQVMVRYLKMQKWADLAQRENTLFQKTGINTEVPVGVKEKRKLVKIPPVPTCKVLKQAAGYSLVQMAHRIADEQTEDPADLELIRQDRANNLFIPRPPDAAIRFKILYRILDRRRKVYDTLSHLFQTPNKKKQKHDDQEIDTCTLKTYIEKRKDVLCPALISQLKEFIVQGRPLKLREILALSKKLKTATRSKSLGNQKVEKEMIKIIHLQIPTIVRKGRPKKIWVEGAETSPEEEEQTRKKVSILLLKAFCLDPKQLLRRAAFNRPGAVNGELLELLRKCRPPPPPGAAQVVEIDSEVVDGATARTTELERRDSDANLSVATDEPGSGSNDGACGFGEVGDQGIESHSSTAMDGTSQDAQVSQVVEPLASATTNGASPEAEINSGGAETQVMAKGNVKSVTCLSKSKSLSRSNSADGGKSVGEEAGSSKDEENRSSRPTRSKTRARSKSGTKDPADVSKLDAKDDEPVEDDKKRNPRQTRSQLRSQSSSSTKEPAESENLVAEDSSSSKRKGKNDSSRTRSKSRSRSSSGTKETEDKKSNGEDSGSSRNNVRRGSQQTRSKSRSRSNSGAIPVVENTEEDSTECQMSGQTTGDDVSTEKAPGGESGKNKTVPIVGKDGNIIGYIVANDVDAQKKSRTVKTGKGSRSSSQTRPSSTSESVLRKETVPDAVTERVQRYPGFVTKKVVSRSDAQMEIIPDKDAVSGGSNQKYAGFVPNRSFVANKVVAPSFSKLISKELNIPRPILADETLETKYPEVLRRIRSPPVKQPYLFVKNEPPLKGNPELYNIPPLPPTATTLFAFRSLLLNRRNLLQTTTKFIRSVNTKARYKKEKSAKRLGQTRSESQIEGGGGLVPSGDRLVVGYKQGVEDQRGIIGGHSKALYQIGPAGDTAYNGPIMNSVSEVKQGKSALKESEAMQVSSTEDVIIQDKPAMCNFATQEDLALNNSLQTKITLEFGKGVSNVGTGLDASGVKACSVVSMSTAEQDMVVFEAGEMRNMEKGRVESNDNQANNDITDGDNCNTVVDNPEISKDLGISASSVSPVVAVSDAGRPSIAVGDNVENGAVISTIATGSDVTTEATVQESWAGQDKEILVLVENTGSETRHKLVPDLTGRPTTKQGSSELGRRVSEPQAGCSTDVTDGGEVRQNTHKVTGDDDATVKLKEVVTGLYGTHDYQMLRSRFLSMFVWPALLSATEVPDTATLQTTLPLPLTKSQRPFKKRAIKVTEEGVKYKKRRYACTSGRRSRAYNFQSKERKAERRARNEEQGKRITNLWRAKHDEITAKVEEGCSEYANLRQENGDAEVKNGAAEAQNGGAESVSEATEVEIGQAEVENAEVEMEIEGAEVEYGGTEEKNVETEEELCEAGPENGQAGVENGNVEGESRDKTVAKGDAEKT
ncbi:uncharacterized protein LOC135501466 [Lineus longissimus]|uniref:uncharacterized protein LOC135501466 n=1 Tax=Lineus longissimus TaxID=88925 RepID=UPI002B4C7382